MNLYWIVLAAGIAATLIFLYLRVKKGGVTGLIAKAVASVGFIATACAALSLNIGFYGYGLLVIVGLVCGLLGDIWLDLKWIYIQDKDTYLYAGMASFFVGHIFFITAILTHFNWAVINILIALAIAVAGAVIVLLIEKPMKMDYGKFKIPSAMYGGILIFTTALAALAAVVTQGEPIFIVMAAGGALFLLSDLVLSGMYFGKGKNTPANVVVNHGLYYAAQFVIASSVIFIK